MAPAGSAADPLSRFCSLLACVESDAPAAERVELLQSARGALVEARRAGASPDGLRAAFTDLVTAANADALPAVRAVAPGAAEDACFRSLQASVGVVTPVIAAALRDDAAQVRISAVRAVTGMFRRIMGLAFALGIVGGEGVGGEGGGGKESTETEAGFPIGCYNTWVAIFHQIVAMVDDRDSGVSNAAVKFVDPATLALSYSGSGLAGTQDHFTLDFAYSNSSRSPGVDITALQVAGKAATSALAGIVTRGVSQEAGALIRPLSYMTAINVLGNLSRRRKLLIDITLPPLITAAAAIVERENTPPAVAALSPGQRSSTVLVLRLACVAICSCSHARVGPVAQNLKKAATELLEFESREYRLVLQAQQMQKEARRAASAAAALAAPANGKTTAPSSHAAKPSGVGEPLDRPPPPPPPPPPRVNPPSDTSALPIPPPPPRRLKTEPVASKPGILPRKPTAVATKRARASSPAASRPRPEAAAMGATFLMQRMPPVQLVNFIMENLGKGPPDLAELERQDKRARYVTPGDENNQSGFGGSSKGGKLSTRPAGNAVKEGEVKASRRVGSRRKTVPVIRTPKLTRESRSRLLQMQCIRILQSEARAAASGAAPLRILALTRLITLATADGVSGAEGFGEKILNFLAEDLAGRYELALAWLHAEAAHSFDEGGPCALSPVQNDDDKEALLSALRFETERIGRLPRGNGSSSEVGFESLADDVPLLGQGDFEGRDVCVKKEEIGFPLIKSGKCDDSPGSENTLLRDSSSKGTVLASVEVASADSKQANITGVHQDVDVAMSELDKPFTNGRVPVHAADASALNVEGPEGGGDSLMGGGDSLMGGGMAVEGDGMALDEDGLAKENSEVATEKCVTALEGSRSGAKGVQGGSGVEMDMAEGDPATRAVTGATGPTHSAADDKQSNETTVENAEDALVLGDSVKRRGSSMSDENVLTAPSGLAAGNDDAGREDDAVMRETDVADEQENVYSSCRTGAVELNESTSTTDAPVPHLDSRTDIAKYSVSPSLGTDRSNAEGVDGENDDEEPVAVGDIALGGRYNTLMVCLLKKASSVLECQDRLFSRLVIEAPVIPECVMDFLKSDCRDAARSRLGLSTLRDIVLERPGLDRDRCLNILLQFAVDSDGVLRALTIRLVIGKLFQGLTGAIPEKVEAFAVEAFLSSLEFVAREDTEPEKHSSLPDSGDSIEPPNDKAIIVEAGVPSDEAAGISSLERNIWLLSTLCAMKESLLVVLVTSFLNSSPAARDIIISRVKDIAGQLGPESEAIMALVRGEDEPYDSNSPEMGDLALAVTIASMAKAGSLPPDCLVEAVRLRYDRTKDARLLSAVLTGLQKNQLLTYLPVLVAIDEPKEGNVTGGFRALISKVMAVRPAIISADELLFELHMLPCTANVCVALKSCFEMIGVFNEEVVAMALQKIMEASYIPDMLMRTVLMARKLYPRLDPYIRETVILGTHGVIRKKVWTVPTMWTGFVAYCVAVQDRCLTMLVRLPYEKLTEVLSSEGELKSLVHDVLEDEVVHINKRDRAMLTAALR